ncbi:MAG: transcriptional repressor NrdR [Clostridia bacterium]|nr:transcriptional repressor NrdR [Clostridia bacterium]MBQ6233124.1 transcriptional repressor NrdR [Clostridia bacterium]
MKCPSCGSFDSKVTDSRPVEDGGSIRRRRECLQCGRRFTTYETLEQKNLLVVKKDQSRELFSHEKLRNGIIAACHKRPVSAAQIEGVVARVEQQAYNSLQEEISTRCIGELVMDELKHLDDVAYIRFASVYRQFTDLPTFLTEMHKLLEEKGPHNSTQSNQ